MTQVIRVLPVDGGWALHCDGVGEPAVFLSGGKAEAMARKTAIRLAGVGVDVHVLVQDRERREAGSHWFRGRHLRVVE